MPNTNPSPNPDSPDGEANLKNWRVLVVDDQPDNLNLAGAVLGFRGAIVELVDNAETALSIIPQFRPDVILTDVAMPGMNGYDFVKAIRKNENVRHIPVIALTVRVSLEDQQQAIAAGFDGYISKPYSASRIAAQVRDIVERSCSKEL